MSTDSGEAASLDIEDVLYDCAGMSPGGQAEVLLDHLLSPDSAAGNLIRAQAWEEGAAAQADASGLGYDVGDIPNPYGETE